MVYCYYCGKKNDDDAQYCMKCGSFIAEGSSFEKNIEAWAEEFGKRAEDFGKRMEKRARAFAKSMNEHGEVNTIQCPACSVVVASDALYCWKCGKKTS